MFMSIFSSPSSQGWWLIIKDPTPAKQFFLIGFKDHPMIKSEGVVISERMSIKF